MGLNQGRSVLLVRDRKGALARQRESEMSQRMVL